MPHALPPPPMNHRLAAVVLVLVAAAVSLLLGASHREFPYFYHLDEADKATQLIERDFNFHHPMLLLTATQLWIGDSSARMDPQLTVQAGRLMSALFTAGAVGALVALATLRAGLGAGFAAALLLAGHQQLIELAHYMKEDPALLLGMALTFLALEFFRRRPSALLALLSGAACGVAVSGKYVGAVALACALPVLLTAGLPTGRQRLSRVALLLLGTALVFSAVNLPLLSNLAETRASFQREMGLVVEGQKGTGRSVPHAIYLNIFAENTSPVIWLLLAVFYGRLWQRRHEQDALGWALALCPLALTVAFSFSPKTNDRYYLPVTALFYTLAAIGLKECIHTMLPQRWPALARRPALATAVLLGAALAIELPRTIAVLVAFQHDDRRALAEFIRDRLPPSARIAQDDRVLLPSERNRRRQRVLLDLPQVILAGKTYAAELGTIEELRADGVTHVAVSESNYGRYFVPGNIARESGREDFRRHQAFYERLFRDGELLFERPRGTVIYLHPGLKLYRLPQG